MLHVWVMENLRDTELKQSGHTFKNDQVKNIGQK